VPLSFGTADALAALGGGGAQQQQQHMLPPPNPGATAPESAPLKPPGDRSLKTQQEGDTPVSGQPSPHPPKLSIVMGRCTPQADFLFRCLQVSVAMLDISFGAIGTHIGCMIKRGRAYCYPPPPRLNLIFV